jgi:hypothetical protein
VEGGGPVGCGCAFLLGLAASLSYLIGLGGLSLWLAIPIAMASGALGWKFGDAYFEKVLGGDRDGKPTRYWFLH